jgi:hypothetical protein
VNTLRTFLQPLRRKKGVNLCNTLSDLAGCKHYNLVMCVQSNLLKKHTRKQVN